MRIVLLLVWKWGMVTGVIKAPDPVDHDNPTADENSAIEAF